MLFFRPSLNSFSAENTKPADIRLPLGKLILSLCLYNFLAVIVVSVRANSMRKFRFMTLWTN